MLPEGFPKWRTCYDYWQKWSTPDEQGHCLLQEALKKCGRSHSTRPWAGYGHYVSDFDAQSVKNTDTAEQKGFDGGKLITGIKRHIGVDTHGLPHRIHVTTANITDRAGALDGFALYKDHLTKVQKVLADGGSVGEPFATAIFQILSATVEIAKRNKLHKFAVIPKHWVVERSFAWLEKCRRLWKTCERKLNTSLQITVLAFLALLVKRS